MSNYIDKLKAQGYTSLKDEYLAQVASSWPSMGGEPLPDHVDPALIDSLDSMTDAGNDEISTGPLATPAPINPQVSPSIDSQILLSTEQAPQVNPTTPESSLVESTHMIDTSEVPLNGDTFSG